MAFAKKTDEIIVIKAPKFEILTLKVKGTAPYVSNKFSSEMEEKMRAAQAAGDKGKSTKREPKDFEAGYRGSMHQSDDGWYGIPAPAFRSACIRACSVSGIEMTKAKMCVFVLADGYEKDGTPLVRIIKGTPARFDAYVVNDNESADIRPRGKWDEGWEVKLRLRYDADLFSASSIANLVQRAGMSVGVGAGRPFSKTSNGQGWGTFEVKEG